jgi:hypothetical protein
MKPDFAQYTSVFTLTPTVRPTVQSTSFFCLTFTLKMVTAIYVETLEQLNSKGSSYTPSDKGHDNPRMRAGHSTLKLGKIFHSWYISVKECFPVSEEGDGNAQQRLCSESTRVQ